MKRIALNTIAMLSMVFSFNLHASTTWVPIIVGDITTIIPYVPSEVFVAPTNTVLTTNGSITTLSWDDIEHASRYEVQAENSQGVWVSIFTTEETSVVIDSRFSSYGAVRVVACSYSSCANTGAWSTTVRINLNTGGSSKIIFIHTDLLGSPVVKTDINGWVL
jgi:hypothetical protein